MHRHGEPLQIGGRDDIAVVWSCGGARRAVVDLPWPGPRLILERVLRQFPGADGHRQSVARQLGRLSTPGASLIVHLPRGHRAGLVATYRASGASGDEPVLLTLGSALHDPVVFGTIARARDFARAEQSRRGEKLAWRLYLAERAQQPETFTPRPSAITHKLVARTTLEEHLIALRWGAGRSGRARAA